MRTDNGSAETPAERYLFDEFRAINAHVPRRRKSLAELLGEERPGVVCGDGSVHSFRRKELEFIAEMLEPGELEDLMLPIIIEVSSERSDMTILSPKGTEAKILSKILGMKFSWTMNRVVVFRAQLAELRRALKTATQYVFMP